VTCYSLVRGGLQAVGMVSWDVPGGGLDAHARCVQRSWQRVSSGLGARWRT
jgi:hypothetical protein